MDKKIEHVQLVEALDLGAAAPPGSGAGTVCGPRTKAPRQVKGKSFVLHRVEGSALRLLAILLPETFTSIAFDGVAPIKGKPGRSAGSSTAKTVSSTARLTCPQPLAQADRSQASKL